MKKGIFITATGTDVGKTYISALMLKHLLKCGFDAGYYKPVLSGAIQRDNKLIPGDCDFVLKFAGLGLEPENFVSYIYKEAVSPHLAAQIENNPVELSKIISDFNNIKKQFDYIIVEGAGGIVCPFRLDNDKKIILPDVIKALGLDIIIVASAGLGTINSTFLTVEYAKKCGINVRGIVLNNYDENNLMMHDNLKQIEALTGVKVIAAVEKNAQDIDFDFNIFKEI